MDIGEYIRQKSNRLDTGGRKIKDYRVFDFNYIPDKPLVREEIKPVADAVLRYAKTGIPNHLLIIGTRGCGKTLLVKSLVKALEAIDGAPRFHYVNCRHHNSSFKILAEILQVRPRGYALDALWAHFCARYPSKQVLILDEADLMSEKDRNKDILYLLSRSENNYMTLLLSNNPQFHTQLDGSIRSTLQPEIIHFKNYNAEQVLEILRQRARLGLRKTDEAHLNHIAALTVRNTNSDIRVGIKTLYFCALEPQAGVEGNFERARRNIALDILRDLNDKNLIILQATQRHR
jgi:cell division control protein 6